MRTIRGALDRLSLQWEAELRRLPWFTQRTAVVLLGVLVATLAMLGGVVALVGWPGAGGPARSRVVGGGCPVRGRRRRRDGGLLGAGIRGRGLRGTRVRRCGRRGRRGPVSRTADHVPADHHLPAEPLDPVDRPLGPVVSTLPP